MVITCKRTAHQAYSMSLPFVPTCLLDEDQRFPNRFRMEREWFALTQLAKLETSFGHREAIESLLVVTYRDKLIIV